MKSKIKSLIFWAAFFFLLITLMFFGGVVLIFNGMLQNDYYNDLLYNSLCVLGYSLIISYFIFVSLIFTNKFPEKIKRFEKIRYLVLMFILLIWELGAIGSVMYDFD